jgi:hypothetical protein
VCSHELPTATEDKSNTAQQTRATGTAREGRDGVVVLSCTQRRVTKTNEKNFQERRRGNF